jgi:hypothetical protein
MLRAERSAAVWRRPICICRCVICNFSYLIVLDCVLLQISTHCFEANLTINITLHESEIIFLCTSLHIPIAYIEKSQKNLMRFTYIILALRCTALEDSEKSGFEVCAS